MLNQFFDKLDIKREAMNANWYRYSLISQNIANIETPNYKRKDIDFESMLKSKIYGNQIDMNLTNIKHINKVNDFSIISHKEMMTSMRQDKNNVNIDMEMAEQAKTLIKYNIVTSRIDHDIKMMKSAIRGGK